MEKKGKWLSRIAMGLVGIITMVKLFFGSLVLTWLGFSFPNFFTFCLFVMLCMVLIYPFDFVIMMVFAWLVERKIGKRILLFRAFLSMRVLIIYVVCMCADRMMVHFEGVKWIYMAYAIYVVSPWRKMEGEEVA